MITCEPIDLASNVHSGQANNMEVIMATARTTARPTRKSAAKKTATRPVKKVAAKKSAAKAPAKKVIAKKKAAPVTRTKVEREFDEHGFIVGTDSSKMAAILCEGGSDRIDVNAKIAKAFKNRTTRYGAEKNVPSLVSGLLSKMQARGYTVESTWKLLPPDQAKKAAPRRKKATVKAG